MRIDEYQGWVTIRDGHGRSWGRAQASLYSDGQTLAGEITAPLWMVSLSGGVSVRFDDGSSGTLRVREIRAMDGPVATVHVEVDGSPPGSGRPDEVDDDDVQQDVIPEGSAGVRA